MGRTIMKGFYKGFKYTLTHMFVVKEREMEIGSPTDVKHLTHIGWDGSSGNSAPSWMKEFKTGPDFAATSICRSASALSPWSSKDIGGSIGHQSEVEVSKATFRTEVMVAKKLKHKKSNHFSPPRRVLRLQ